MSVKIPGLIVASPSPLLHLGPIPRGQALKMPLHSPWGETKAGVPKEQPTALGELGVHPGLSETTGGARSVGTVPAGGRGNAVCMPLLLLPSEAACLGLCGAGDAQP